MLIFFLEAAHQPYVLSSRSIAAGRFCDVSGVGLLVEVESWLPRKVCTIIGQHTSRDICTLDPRRLLGARSLFFNDSPAQLYLCK